MKTIKMLKVLVAGLMVAGNAPALMMTIDTGNSAISGYTGPYGQMELSLTDSTHALFTFTSFDSSVGGYHYLFGDGSSVALNLNGDVELDGSVSSSPKNISGAISGPFSLGGPGNVSEWGYFSFSLKDFDGFGRSADSISFTLANSTGSWADENDVLKANSSGYSVAAHIFVADANYTTALNTGYAIGRSVPDGGMTVGLLGMAIAAMGMIARKLR